MFPSDSPAQGSGQQYPFYFNNGYYIDVPKRPCLPSVSAQLQYPFSPFPMMSQQYSAPVYPQSYGYPPMEEESRRRKIVQVIPEYERPIWTFTGLSLLALLNAPDNTATTDEIYTFVLSHFPFYIDQIHASWTGAIRHAIHRFDALIGRFLPSQSTPTAPSVSPVLSALLSSSPIYYEECAVIQHDQITSPITLTGTSYQSVPVNDFEDLSTASLVFSDNVFNAPIYTEDFPAMHFDQSNSHISFNGTDIQSVPVSDLEDSPALSVEHLEFEIINDDF